MTSDRAEFLYKTTDYYAPEHERLRLWWNDADLAIRLASTLCRRRPAHAVGQGSGVAWASGRPKFSREPVLRSNGGQYVSCATL